MKYPFWYKDLTGRYHVFPYDKLIVFKSGLRGFIYPSLPGLPLKHFTYMYVPEINGYAYILKDDLK